MIRTQWRTAGRKHILCVDSYENRILQGRLSGTEPEEHAFSSLAELLVWLEAQPDNVHPPGMDIYQEPPQEQFSPVRRGAKATFELQILFQQHNSWQGLLKWREKNIEQSFKSALELVLLIDSALEGKSGI